MVLRVGASSFKGARKMGVEVYRLLKFVIKKKLGQDAINDGDEGGFAHNIQENKEGFVPTWIDGVENSEYVGVGARFGHTLESKEKRANLIRVVMADPPDCCTKPKNKITSEVILVHRGKCSFTTKANIADEAGASAILIINYRIELFKMVCEENKTYVDIGIPAVMRPQDAELNFSGGSVLHWWHRGGTAHLLVNLVNQCGQLQILGTFMGAVTLQQHDDTSGLYLIDILAFVNIVAVGCLLICFDFHLLLDTTIAFCNFEDKVGFDKVANDKIIELQTMD
ncbi:hypothetical protein VNO78_11684 [Psophocarpus tetragonolobus]|uniref:phosphopyruvate hydratase n=1 Tax=Psophocarpus tetragonolobus TaxID=3891 RepID=A0AAN9SPR0_PSOTE